MMGWPPMVVTSVRLVASPKAVREAVWASAGPASVKAKTAAAAKPVSVREQAMGCFMGPPPHGRQRLRRRAPSPAVDNERAATRAQSLRLAKNCQKIRRGTSGFDDLSKLRQFDLPSFDQLVLERVAHQLGGGRQP